MPAPKGKVVVEFSTAEACALSWAVSSAMAHADSLKKLFPNHAQRAAAWRAFQKLGEATHQTRKPHRDDTA